MVEGETGMEVDYITFDYRTGRVLVTTGQHTGQDGQNKTYWTCLEYASRSEAVKIDSITLHFFDPNSGSQNQYFIGVE